MICMKIILLQRSKKTTIEIITILIASNFFNSCDPQIPAVKHLSAELKEGKLTYSISGKGTTSN